MSFPASALRPAHPPSRPLAQLVTHFGCEYAENISENKEIEIRGVSLNSKDIIPGDLYVGVPGSQVHGASYASDAAQLGAAAVLTDREGAVLLESAPFPVLIAPNVRAILGDIAAWVYDTPHNSPQLFAVTGTNGKTSVVYMLAGLLDQMGVVSGLSSTAERRIGEIAITSSLTTPEAPELHALVARMHEEHVRAAAIEVSAQALSRHRIDGFVFDVAGFTNLSYEHFDDYPNYDEYFEAKLQLFQPDRAHQAVVTIDTEWGQKLVERSGVPVTTLTSLPQLDADWRMTVREESAHNTVFQLDGPENRSLTTHVPFIGHYMASNAALAIVMLVEGGFSWESIVSACTQDGGIRVYVPGRLEKISGDAGPMVFIDYGHTPDAFSSTLDALRKVVTGRIIMVFGADGDRDATKRADMGAIAARGADVVVVTDFNPRWEDPAAIRHTLITAAQQAVPDCEIYERADPPEAFRFALSLAHTDDVILYAGPGHEDYHDVAGQKVPYSARDDARSALSDAGWPTSAEPARRTPGSGSPRPPSAG